MLWKQLNAMLVSDIVMLVFTDEIIILVPKKYRDLSLEKYGYWNSIRIIFGI